MGTKGKAEKPRLVTTWFKVKNLSPEQRVDRTIAYMTSEIMVRAGVEAAAAGDPSGRTSRKILRQVRDNINAALDVAGE